MVAPPQIVCVGIWVISLLMVAHFARFIRLCKGITNCHTMDNTYVICIHSTLEHEYLCNYVIVNLWKNIICTIHSTLELSQLVIYI